MVSISRAEFRGWPNCFQLDNSAAQVIVTSDIGPRIACYRLNGSENILGELGPEEVVPSEFGDYHLWGGHRLWHAPEGRPRSYVPDDAPVAVELVGEDAVRLSQRVEQETGILKEMLVRLDSEGSGVTVEHRLTNTGIWPVELAPWSPTIMRGGGVTIFPNEPFIPEEEKVLPARPIVVWHYTNLGDPRLTFGDRYIRLRTDASRPRQIKLGAMNKQGWAAYLCEGALFVKWFPFFEDETYPDYGCNFETYTAADFMEVESLGPMVTLAPGSRTTHTERWALFADVSEHQKDEDLAAVLEPLVSGAAQPAIG